MYLTCVPVQACCLQICTAVVLPGCSTALSVQASVFYLVVISSAAIINGGPCTVCDCHDADGQAAQLLAGMLAGTLIHNLHRHCSPRERDLMHMVDLVQSHLCKGQPDRGLQVMGRMQYVHVSQYADDWLEEMVFDEGPPDLFGA